MLKKTITYTDYNGGSRTEDFYFNLTKAEVAEMELSAASTGGIEKTFKKMVDDIDGKQIMETIKSLILKSYGEKSVDGRRFVKSSELSENFAQTEAYSELFMELVLDSDKAAAFITGIMPTVVDNGKPAVGALPANG
ncbi:MAG: hypothetical protein NC078_06340 [Ruminococcus sp.]|nr:hypothetical protein [Ruminococcus sp.]